jgi:hypothetical protein
LNCVIDEQDSTGPPSTCRAIKQLITGLRLHDVWTQPQTTKIYTQYTTRGHHVSIEYILGPTYFNMRSTRKRWQQSSLSTSQ